MKLEWSGCQGKVESQSIKHASHHVSLIKNGWCLGRT